MSNGSLGDVSKGEELPVAAGKPRADWRSLFTPFYTRIQMFCPRAGNYTEEASSSVFVRTDGWQTAEIVLPPGMRPEGRLRLDPGDARGVVEIAEIELLAPGAVEPFWSAPKAAGCELAPYGTAVDLRRPEALTLLSYRDDPVLILPPVDEVPAGSRLRVRLRARVGEAVFWAAIQTVVEDCLAGALSPLAHELVATAFSAAPQLFALLDRLQADREELPHRRTELLETNRRLELAGSALTDTCSRLAETRSELAEAGSELEKTRSELAKTRSELAKTRSELAKTRSSADAAIALLHAEEKRLRSALEEAREGYKAVLVSWSWRVTAPVRWLAKHTLLRRGISGDRG